MLGGAHRRVGAGDPPWQLRCPRHLSVGPAAHHRYADLEKEETQVLTGEPIPVVAALPRCRDLLLGLLDLRQGADRVTGLASRRNQPQGAEGLLRGASCGGGGPGEPTGFSPLIDQIFPAATLT